MARSQKRTRRKSPAEGCQSAQNTRTTRKRKTNCKTEGTESHIQPKLRRSSRLNLQHSDSVILVSETPCIQCPEQQKKYTNLGLNSALFLKGSQRPKRKQSHISIITISSDDDETSEERTFEWVSQLNIPTENQQPSKEPELLNMNENEENVVSTTENMSSLHNPICHEPAFQPLCSSTPNTSNNLKSTFVHQRQDKESQICTLTSTESLTEPQQKKLNESRILFNFGSTSSTEVIHDPLQQDQPMTNNIATNLQSPIQYQPDNTGRINFDIVKPTEEQLEDRARFYFGLSSTINPFSLIKSIFDKKNNSSTSDACKSQPVNSKEGKEVNETNITNSSSQNPANPED